MDPAIRRLIEISHRSDALHDLVEAAWDETGGNAQATIELVRKRWSARGLDPRWIAVADAHPTRH